MGNDSARMRNDALESMGLREHIDALRAVLLRSVALVLLLWVVMFAAMPWIFDNVILAPCSGDFVFYRWMSALSAVIGIESADFVRFEVRLMSINLSTQFFTHISMSLWMAIVVATPGILYQLWLFISPGLYVGERRSVAAAFAGGGVLFFIGLAIGYYIVFPLTLRFLSDYQLSAFIPNHISLDSYMDNFITLNLLMGLIFELPLVVWLLGRLGLLNRRMLVRYRRHAIVFLLVVAAVITPTGDPFTLMVVFFPLYILWEAGAFLVRN